MLIMKRHFYIYNALFPNRRDGYEWSGVVPGNTSETLWNSYLGYDDLPKIYNAESGFIQIVTVHHLNQQMVKITPRKIRTIKN